jgi:hypothetical protein
MKKRQNQDLEILRMGVLCIPLIVVLCAFIMMRKEDTAMKTKQLPPVEYHMPQNIVQDYGKRPGHYEGEVLLPMGHQRY